MENPEKSNKSWLYIFSEVLMIAAFFLFLAAIPLAISIGFHNLVKEHEKLIEVLEQFTPAAQERAIYSKITAYPASVFKGKTATGAKTTPGWTAACSKELMRYFLGRRIYVEGHGVWKVTELMNDTVQGKVIDLCVPTENDAVKFGYQLNKIVVALD